METEDYLKAFCEYLRYTKDLSENSVNAYCHDVKNYLEKYPQVNLINETEIMSYLLCLQKEDRKSSTQARMVISLRAFCAFLLQQGVLKDNPMLHIHIPRAQNHTPEILTVEEVDKLLSQPDMDSPKGIRDKAMLEFLYASGMKVSEMIDMKLSMLHLDIGCVECRHGKNVRIIPLGKICVACLVKYLVTVRPSIQKEEVDYVFLNMRGGKMSRQGFWKLMKFYQNKAGFSKELGPNMLRNSFAAHLVERGADLRSVQLMMGHQDISSTQRYAAFVKNRLKETYDGAHPRA